MTSSLLLQLTDPSAATTQLAQGYYNDYGTDPETEAFLSLAGLAFWVVLIVGAVLYFVPAIIAMTRHHPNTAAIVILNLLAGWTFIGWVGAAVWSFTTPQASNTTVYVQPGVTAAGARISASPSPPGWHPDPHGAGGQRWWDGQTWTNHVHALPEAQQRAVR